MNRCSLCGGEILDRTDSRYCVYCNSTFHRGCIIDHFYRNKYCPVCNKPMSLIFMRYGLPPESAIKKRAMPKEIRRPKWPHYEKRPEVPVFDIDIPSGPLKRSDKYIPKAVEKRKRGFPKIPVKLLAVVLILAVGVFAAYYSLGSFSFPLPGREAAPASPWSVVWTYPLEGVSDIAASDYGIVIGSRSGLTVLDAEGNVLWQKEGEVSSVDISRDTLVASNRGVVEIYSIGGDELARYGEGTCEYVSLSEFGILAAGLSEGGVVLLDIYGNVLDQYETGPVGSVSISPDATRTAYREGATVYVLDVTGEAVFAFEDGGSSGNRIAITSSGLVLAHTGSEVFLYDGQNVVWSAEAGGCQTAGLAVSADETQAAANADTAAIYSMDGQLLYTLPKGSCGGIAFLGDDVMVSDPGTVYYLQKKEEPEPTEEGEGEGEQAPEQEEVVTEPGSFEEWFTWYQSFLAEPGNAAEYDLTVEEEGEISQEMHIRYSIEMTEETLTETITMIVQAGEQTLETTFQRWITPEGSCEKAQMVMDSDIISIECHETTIRGIDFREILHYQDWEYLGQEEITVAGGTFMCHKAQISTDKGILTIWIAENQPPIRITLQDSDITVTMELV